MLSVDVSDFVNFQTRKTWELHPLDSFRTLSRKAENREAAIRIKIATSFLPIAMIDLRPRSL